MKIILIAIIMIVLLAVLMVLMKSSGSIGIIGGGLALIAFAGIRAIWKYDSNNSESENKKLKP